MKLIFSLLFFAIFGIGQRFVENRVFVSTANPAIKAAVDSSFTYVGNFPFSIVANSDEYPADLQQKVVAEGERYVFISAASDGNISKLFVVQLEGFLDNNNQIYRYRLENGLRLGEKRYRNNTFFFDQSSGSPADSTSDVALTRRFLRGKGYSIENELMASRFVGIADSLRKHEIIFFYMEPMSQSGHTLPQLEKGEIDSTTLAGIRSGLIERSLKSFKIIEC